MFSRLLVAGLMVLVLASAVEPAAAPPAPDMNEPVILTKQLLADLICLACTENAVLYRYDGATSTLTVKFGQDPSDAAAAGGSPKMHADWEKSSRPLYRNRAERRVATVLALLRRHVDPSARVKWENF